MTDKQKLFISKYCISFNATQSAIVAGYSEDTAYSIGWELLRKPEIREAIQKHIDETLSDDKLVLKRKIIDELSGIAFTDEGIDVRTNKDGEIYEVSRRDKIRALELLGKYMVMFTDKQELQHTTIDDEGKATGIIVSLEKAYDEAGKDSNI